MRKESNELRIGRAGEHFIMFDLLVKGHTAFLTEQGVPYDIVIETESQFIRIQVKSATKPRYRTKIYKTPTYIFDPRRVGKKYQRTVRKDDFDGFAFALLDIKEACYIPLTSDLSSSIIVRDRNFPSKGYRTPAPDWQDLTLEKFLGYFK